MAKTKSRRKVKNRSPGSCSASSASSLSSRSSSQSRSGSSPGSASSSSSSSRKRTRPAPKRSRFKGKVQAFLTNQPSTVENQILKDHSVLFLNKKYRDLNLPIPVCQGIRRVCAFHDKSRKYSKYQNDNSDNFEYKIAFKPKKLNKTLQKGPPKKKKPQKKAKKAKKKYF